MLKKINLLALIALLVFQTMIAPIAATAQVVPEDVNTDTSENLDNAELVNVPEDNEDLENEISDANEESAEDDTSGGVSEDNTDDDATAGDTEAEDDVPVDDTNDAASVEDPVVDEEPTVDNTNGDKSAEDSKADETPTADNTTDDSTEKAIESDEEPAVNELYEAAKKAVEKALESEKQADIEKALELIAAVEDEALQAELAVMLGDLQVRPAAEQSNEFFDFKISEIKDLQGNPYSVDNPLKPDDEFWVRIDWELKNGHSYKGGDTTTFDLPKELHLDGEFDGELEDQLGNLVATYEITQDGEVTLTFTDFVESNSQVTGWLEVRAALDQTVVEEEDGKVVIGPIEDEGEQVLPLDRNPINKTVEKQGQPNKSYNADEIEWTVTINKNANSLKDVTLEDVLPEGTEYVEDSLKAVKQAATLNGTPVGDATDVSVTPSVTDGKLSIPLGDIEEVYTVTYTTKVTDTDQTNFKNNIAFKDADLDDTNADATVTINRGEPLKKGAVKNYDPKTGIIEWYLEFNYDQKDLNDVTLADNWTPAGKVELVDGSLQFQEVEIDENGNGQPVGNPVDPNTLGSFSKVDDGFEVSGITTDKPYYVVYQTKVKDRELDGFRMENLASFGEHEEGTGYNIGQYLGAKSAGNIDYAAKTIDWTIKVNMDHRQMKDVIIEDTLGDGLTLLNESVKMTIGGQETEGFTLDDGNPFTLSGIGDTNQEIIVTYTTAYDPNKLPDNYEASNKANISWIPEGSTDRINRDVEAKTPVNAETVNSSWKNASYNPDTKEITWTIIANYRENDYENFNITDTPQGNQWLIEDSIKVEELEINADGSRTIVGAVNPVVATNGNDIEINIGKTDKAYQVTYRTSIAGLDDVAKEYTNEAQVKDGDEVLADIDAKVGVYGERKYGNKRGEQDGRKVNWSIDVNLAQEKISNLELEDTISDNQAYIEESITVYNAKVNPDGTVSKTDEVPSADYELVVNETDFTVSWNDDVERAFVVEYATLFFEKDAEEVRNDYKITGDGITEEDSDASDGYSVTIRQTSGGGADGTAGYLRVHKVDTTYGQPEQPLAGIQFELVDANNDQVLKTITTDADGYADFGRLLFGEYKLREVNTPEGYVGFDEQIIEINEEFIVGDSDPVNYQLRIENYQVSGVVEIIKRDNDGNLLEGVEFTLFKADGTPVDKQTTDEKGEISFKKQAPGQYYVQETKALHGFELDNTQHAVELTETQKEAIQLELTNERKVTSVTLVKEWVDPEGTELRPDEVTVNLFRNGEFLETHTIKESAGWELTVNGLHAEDENGKPYEYSMIEQEVEGYAPSFDDSGLKVTNTRAEEREFTFTKTWLDDQNKDGDRPTEVTVELFRSVEGGDEELVDTYTLKAENDWELTTEQLPMFDENGMSYHYEVKEQPVEGYKTQVDGFDITNTRVGTTEIKGEKFWKDENDLENRPDSITIHLIQNGEPIDTQEVKANEDGKWLYSFDNLEKYDAQGVAYNYTIVEDPVFGYQEMYWSTTPGIINIDNTRVGTTSLTGQKTWVDGDNAEETRPEAIEVQLLQNGEPYGESIEVTADDDWTYKFEGLPAYDNDGVAYEYTIEEVEVEGYETTYDGNDIINTLVGETEVSAEKVWKGEAAEEVSVQLLSNDDVIETATITAEKDWTHTFTELPIYDAEGLKIDYTVQEVAIDGYSTEVTGNVEDGFTITNTRTGETEVAVTKAWLGAEGDSATVHLLANGERVEDQSVVLTAENDWTHTFEALEAFDTDGQPIEYTVEEEAMEGFTPRYDGDVETGFVITNVRSGETSVNITKTWKDEGETDHPETITVNLLANNTFVSEHEVTAANDWTLTIDELPKYDEIGEEIEYSITEQDVPGYEAVIDGFDITNTRVDEKSITINKAWLDDESADRPTSIEVEVFRSVEGGDKESVDTYEVTAENGWALTIDELPAFDEDGKAYTYEIEEVDVEGYESTINGFDITNVRVGETAVDVTKVWKGEAADSATVYLLANGEEVEGQTVDLTEENDWMHTFANLDKYDEDGKTITYTVKERPMEGYESNVTGNMDEGFTVTNLRVGITVIAGTKTWVDNDAENLRPLSITLQILQNGKEIDTVTVTPKSNWTYAVPNLPKYDENGKLYEYTVVEDEVEGYRSTVDGYDITNTLKTYAIGDYVWVDRNKDGIQGDNEEPLEDVTVELFDENDEKIAETKTDKNGRYVFDELPAGNYKVKFTLTKEQAKKYKFTKQNADDNSTEDSDADPETGFTKVIELNDENEHVTKDYEDQPFKATEGIDPTWDAGVIELIDITITKQWVDKDQSIRPDVITVDLLANGEKISDHEVTADSTWTLTIEGLDKYDTNGEEIVYTIEEHAVSEYNTSVDGFDITNTRKTYAIGDYTWIDSNKDGIQDEGEKVLPGVKVELFDEDGEFITETETDKNGRYIFDELPAGNYKVKFTLTEEQAKKYKFTKQNAGDDPTADSDADEKGWTKEISLNDNNKQLTKEYKDQPFNATEGIDPTWDAGVIELIDITITKQWVDKDQSIRPDVITVDLLANGEKVSDYKVTEDSTWTLTIEGLDKYDTNGEEIVYTIEEHAVSEYKTSIDGFDITNTRKTYAIGDYTWIDSNKDGIQDEDEEPLVGVTVELFDEKGNKVAETTTDKNGRYIFDELESGNYKVKFTLTKEQAKKYKFTKQNADDNSTEDSDADPETGFTKVIELNETNEHVTKDYEDQDFKATEGIDPTWDAGVIKKTYAIGDYVWVDRNKDGIQDKDEEPLEGVKVELFDDKGEKIAETTTDKDGRYIFDELESGNYKVKFTLTKEQAKKYTFTKQSAGKDGTVDSDADENGWTKEISLNDSNKQLTKEYKDQAFKATEGIDPTWDAGVIEIPEQPVEPQPEDPKPEQPQPEDPKPEQPSENGKPTDSNNKGEGNLPNTATNTFNYLFIGFVLLALGATTLLIRKRRKE